MKKDAIHHYILIGMMIGLISAPLLKAEDENPIQRSKISDIANGKDSGWNGKVAPGFEKSFNGQSSSELSKSFSSKTSDLGTKRFSTKDNNSFNTKSDFGNKKYQISAFSGNKVYGEDSKALYSNTMYADGTKKNPDSGKMYEGEMPLTLQQVNSLIRKKNDEVAASGVLTLEQTKQRLNKD